MFFFSKACFSEKALPELGVNLSPKRTWINSKSPFPPNLPSHFQRAYGLVPSTQNTEGVASWDKVLVELLMIPELSASVYITNSLLRA